MQDVVFMEANIMTVGYKRLWKMLLDKDMMKKDIQKGNKTVILDYIIFIITDR